MAPSAVIAQLAQQRAHSKTKKRRYRVAYPSVLDLPTAQVTGLAKSKNLKSFAKKQNKKAKADLAALGVVGAPNLMQKMVRSRLRRWSNGEPSADGNCAAYASTSTVAGVSREARNSGLSGMMILI
jgi:hypothetical protein